MLSWAGLKNLAGAYRAWVAPALIALVLVGGWGLLSRGPQVFVSQAKLGDVAEVVYATGVVEPVHWAKIAAPTRKRITELCTCEGETVTTGEVLARLDDAAETAQLRELQARLERIKADAERLKGLARRSVVSQASYDEKLTQLQEHKARVAAQQERVAELALKSPMDGVVLRRDGEVGEIAGTAPGDAILWVGQPKPLRVVAVVNEEDVFGVVPGQKVFLRHDGHSGAPLPATVDRITPKGDPETKTFRVYLSLPDDSPMMIGMNVEANIVVKESRGAVLAPIEALIKGRVQTVQDGRVASQAVETGVRGAALIEIRSGLKAGASVLSPALPNIEDGARVRAVTAPSAAENAR